MAASDFEAQLTALVKTVVAGSRAVTESRGQPSFVEQSKQLVANTREFGNYLQRAQREELLPHAKKVQVSVGQLIRVANNIGASTTEVEESYKTVVADIRAFCHAAKTDGSSSPLSPRHMLGGSPARTDSPLATRNGATRPPMLGSTRAPPAQSTPDLLSVNAVRDSPSPRGPLAISSAPAGLKKQPPALTVSTPAPASPSSPVEDDEYAPAEDDDEEMIQLKRKLAALKRQKEEVESAALGRPLSVGRTPASPTPAPALSPASSPLDEDVETDALKKEFNPDICFTCGRKPQDGPDLLSAVDRRWHKTCWQCYECKKPLVIGDPFGSDGPRVYCEEDYKRKFFCAHCGDFIEDEAEEQGRKLYHLECYVKFLDDKNRKEKEKMEQKQKQMAEDDAAYRKWMEEFEKITKRPTSVAPPPPVSPNKGGTMPASVRAPPNNEAQARRVSQSASDLADPAQFPKVQGPDGAGAAGGVAFGTTATDLLSQLGKPPSARDDPAGYKAYMRKKFALEEQVNKELLAKQRFAKK